MPHKLVMGCLERLVVVFGALFELLAGWDAQELSRQQINIIACGRTHFP